MNEPNKIRSVIHIHNNDANRSAVLGACPEINIEVLHPGESAGVVIWKRSSPQDLRMPYPIHLNPVKMDIHTYTLARIKREFKDIVSAGYSETMTVDEFLFMLEQNEKYYEEQLSGGQVRSGEP